MNLTQILFFAIPVILAVTVHEVAHGWTAKVLGDDTAYRQGRLSLNPIRHIDPIGSLLVPGVMYLFTGFAFGWARPVPIDWRRLRNVRRDMALVAAAGPGANLLMILLWGVVLRVAVELDPGFGRTALNFMSEVGIIINAMLMVLNLFPVPPLDGSRVVTALLPGRYAVAYNRLEPFGLIIVVLLLVSGLLGSIIWPTIAAIDYFIRSLVIGTI